MKKGLLFIVFAFFALMLVSLKDANREQKVQDIPCCKVIDIGMMNGEVPSVGFSLQRALPEVTYFQPVNEWVSETTYKYRSKFSEKDCKLYISEPPGANPAPRIRGLSILHPSDKDDLPNLLS